jgi:uncharacterized membrane protein YfcA
MLIALLYFIIVVAATTLGAMTGMGGGVIIKPALDVLNDFDVATIGILSSISVFSMAAVSVLKQIRQKAQIKFSIAIPLALGSVAGGLLGELTLKALIDRFDADGKVKVIQNVILAVLIISIFFYMLNRAKVPTLGIKHIVPVVLSGVFLGVMSSFLGIGGGPINVALLIFLFSFDVKSATVCSIITILFAQVSKLLTVALTPGQAFDGWPMVLPMVIGAISGGFAGSWLNKRLSEKTVVICFNCVQLLVFATCIYNIVVNSAS